MRPPTPRLVLLMSLAGVALVFTACGERSNAPPAVSRDARFGYLGGAGAAPSASAACADWQASIVARDPHADTHVSFADATPAAACFTRVVHAGRSVLVGRVPEGCAVPIASQRDAMRALADRLDRLRDDEPSSLYPCALSTAQRAAASRHNAQVLRAVASRGGAYPYSAVIVPGYGESGQADTSVAKWLPDQACHAPETGDLLRFGAMVQRTERAADAIAAGVAPVAIVSGGAVHSSMVEAFAMLYLLECLPAARAEHVLVEPCAEHTHTNLRNSGRWLVAMGGRVAYLVTDDDVQADYFQDWNAFNPIRGSIDARSLRDWGYVIGSWRQASVGMDAGFWFTPYRFWAEPRDGVGSLTCVGDPVGGIGQR